MNYNFTCPYCRDTGKIKLSPGFLSDDQEQVFLVECRCPRCAARFRLRIGKQEFEGQVHGVDADDVAKVVKEFVKDIDQMGDKIEISNSTIGFFNTGTVKKVKSINANMHILDNEGHKEVARALQCISQAVISSEDISEESRIEIVEQIEEVSRQATLPSNQRTSKGVIKALLSGIATGLGAAGGLAEVWSTWGSVLVNYFN